MSEGRKNDNHIGIYKIQKIIAQQDLLDNHPKGLHLHFKLGPQNYKQYFNKNNNSVDRCNYLFQKQAEETLIVYSDESQNDRIVFGEVLLTPFVTIRDTRHEVTLHLIYRGQNKKIVNELAGKLTMEIEYTEKLECKLDVSIVRADLINDTESFGKMDPFVAISTTPEDKFFTKTSTDGGLKPKWNEQHSFRIVSPMASLKVQVFDKQVIGFDKPIGQCSISLMVNGLLEVTPQFVLREYRLFCNGEAQAGKIILGTRFSIVQ